MGYARVRPLSYDRSEAIKEGKKAIKHTGFHHDNPEAELYLKLKKRKPLLPSYKKWKKDRLKNLTRHL